MNVICLMGRTGKDAEKRYTASGDTILSWSLAVDVGRGENKETLWFDCSLFGKRGDAIADFIRKGDMIGVTGELSTHESKGKTYLQVRVNEVTLAPKPKTSNPAVTKPPPSSASVPQGDFQDDEIPF